MERDPQTIHRPFMLRNPPQMEVDIPFEGDLEGWLIRLEVYSPMDEDRKRELDHWRKATDKERGEAFYGILSIIGAMQNHLRPKPPLEVRFPVPYHAPAKR